MASRVCRLADELEEDSSVQEAVGRGQVEIRLRKRFRVVSSIAARRETERSVEDERERRTLSSLSLCRKASIYVETEPKGPRSLSV